MKINGSKKKKLNKKEKNLRTYVRMRLTGSNLANKHIFGQIHVADLELSGPADFGQQSC